MIDAVVFLGRTVLFEASSFTQGGNYTVVGLDSQQWQWIMVKKKMSKHILTSKETF